MKTSVAETERFWPPDLVNCGSRAVLFEDLAACLRARRGFALATLNLDHIVKMYRQPDFLAAYRQQTHVVADGRPIVWLRRMAGCPVDLMPGSELVEPLLALAARLDVPVAFLGSRAEVLDIAARRMSEAYSGLRVECRIAPAMGYDPDGAQAEDDLHRVIESGAGLCVIALGAPKQERLAARGRQVAPEIGFVSVGAGLDFIAGHQKRAPRWLRRIALEWLWRMLSDPFRLTGRYAGCAAVLPVLTRDALARRRKTMPK